MSSGAHQVRLHFVAKDEGSRQKPFSIIEDGRYGPIKAVSKLGGNGSTYEIVVLLAEDDPEELLTDLRTNGVHVLDMWVDGTKIFTHTQRRKRTSIKPH